MQTLHVNDFNLKATVESGQIFRWELLDGWYYVTAGSRILRIKQEGEKVIYKSNDDGFNVSYFFDLENPEYPEILQRISSKSDLVKSAVESYRGMRIIRQDPWECTASFICSSFSNIKRIKANLNLIARKFGEKVSLDTYDSHAFPTAKVLSGNFKLLDSCGLGYRAKYLFEASRDINDGFRLHSIEKLPYEKAVQKITELPGIGKKVADCILLFSLGFSEAFPVDVWMERIMRHDLGDDTLKTAEMANLARNKFGADSGYAQQFLYHYARNFKSVLLS